MIRQGGQNGNFIRCVKPFDVGGGVEFRIAELLSPLECCGIVRSLVAHGGEDIVCRSVYNALYLLDFVGLHSLLDSPYDGNAAYAACLEIKPCARLFRRRLKLIPMFGKQLFVCRNNALARLERLQQKRPCRLYTAEKLRNDRYVGVFDDVGNVRRYDFQIDSELLCPVEILFKHGFDFYVKTESFTEIFTVFDENFISSSANRSKT